VKAGFGAGLLEDDPDTKNVKVYLVLTVGAPIINGATSDITGVVKGMEDVDVLDPRTKRSGPSEMKKGSKAWIIKKKEQMERKGKVVKSTSKYTGRKRRVAF
jgi:18S rRNA (guanine1575-N7)-methyltransferase